MDTKSLESLGYGNKGKASSQDYTASIISSVEGLLGESLHLFEHIRAEGAAQTSTRAKVFEIIDLTLKTFIPDMKAAYGIKPKKFTPPNHEIVDGAIVCEKAL